MPESGVVTTFDRRLTMSESGVFYIIFEIISVGWWWGVGVGNLLWHIAGESDVVSVGGF